MVHRQSLAGLPCVEESNERQVATWIHLKGQTDKEGSVINVGGGRPNVMAKHNVPSVPQLGE